MTRSPRTEARGAEQPQTNDELKEDFARVRSQLLKAHRNLSALQEFVRDDPWLERHQLDRLAELHEERERLLSDCGRASLAWMLRGGHIDLREAREAPPSRARPETSASSTDARAASTLAAAVAAAQETGAAQGRPDPVSVATLLEPMGEVPENLDSSDAVANELGHLMQSIQSNLTSAWAAHGKTIQRALVGHVVARARRVQDEVPTDLMPSGSHPDLDRIFSSMTAYSKREQPGFVFGLMRSHAPVHGSWSQDARAWLNDLETKLAEEESEPVTSALATLEFLCSKAKGDVGGAHEQAILDAVLACTEAGLEPDHPHLVHLLMPWYDRLQPPTAFGALRAAILVRESRDATADEEEDGPSDDWMLADALRGKRVGVLGSGAVSEETRDGIQAAFGFALLDWVTLAEAHNAEQLHAAVEGGIVQLVLVLRRYVGLPIEERLQGICEAAGVPCVPIEGATNVTTLRAALERHLEG